MSAIRYGPKFKPVKCQFCGAEYEYEKGDHIHVLGSVTAGRMANGEFVGETTPMLQCPVCGMGNKLERKVKEESENDR